MSAKAKPVVFRPRARIKDDQLSPSSLELYDLMYMETCVTAEALWQNDWNFCPVCLAAMDDFGVITHRPRKLIAQ